MAAVLLTPPYLQFVDQNGVPYAGGLLYSYSAGTGTPKDTYTDSTGTVAATNPVVLDAAGRATIWLADGGSYKFELKTSAGVTVSPTPTDNITAFSNATGLSVLGSIAANSIIGNNTGASIAPLALTIAQVRAMFVTSGTWTPTITFATPGDLTVAYSVRVGKYVDDGTTITAEFNITTSTFTHTTASGAFSITGLPSVSENVTNQSWIGSVYIGGYTKANFTSVTPRVSANASAIDLVASGSGQAPTALASGDMPSAGSVNMSGTVTYKKA